MPATWELHIQRTGEQIGNNKRRTVGRYQVLLDGSPVQDLSGATAETRGPGANAPAGNNRCIEAGSYNLHVQSGEKYATIGYTANTNPTALRRPGLLLMPTGQRVGILIHPARGFLWSVGCINPTAALPNAASAIDFLDSRRRVIALIDSLRAFCGASFPTQAGARIPGAKVIISET
ncbi:hypothetical protein [Phreatobacter oligotrophus]|jgi:hypothetical protein|uniref:DUF5675 domain-containing protein n=1 Tax=Phreatobacter oligotrophus TaxID=1122261 RepID=A0A2T4YYW7_9HYPH|nr:hypothetical protein [Phreatobacter oligotrophus]PTM51921.1 hypothetical protein C8P69_109209 [Phreatobacter oligotrophus]